MRRFGRTLDVQEMQASLPLAAFFFDCLLYEGEPLVDRGDIGVAQGFVEDSNVNPVLEMTRLIQVQRAFDQVSALMRDSESALDSAITTLGGGS